MTYALLIAFLIFNAADAVTTLYGIRKGLREVNPLMAKLFAKVGVPAGVFIAKVPVSIGAIYCVLTGIVQLWFVLALALPYAGLVAWNIYQLRRNGVL